MGYFRNPKTRQEIRSVLDEDLKEVKHRKRNLPNSYDDVHRSDAKTKTWKKFRKNQYKGN